MYIEKQYIEKNTNLKKFDIIKENKGIACFPS